MVYENSPYSLSGTGLPPNSVVMAAMVAPVRAEGNGCSPPQRVSLQGQRS